MIRCSALACLALLAASCGSTHRNAESQALAVEGVTAAHQLATTPGTLEPEDLRERVAIILATVGDLLAPPLDVLAAGEEVRPAMSADAIARDPRAYQARAAPVAQAAREEAEDLAWWRGVWQTLGGWIDRASESWLGLSLGLTGGAGAAGLIAKALGWRRRLKGAAQRVAEWQDQTGLGGERVGDVLDDVAAALGPRDVAKRRRPKAPHTPQTGPADHA